MSTHHTTDCWFCEGTGDVRGHGCPPCNNTGQVLLSDFGEHAMQYDDNRPRDSRRLHPEPPPLWHRLFIGGVLGAIIAAVGAAVWLVL